MIWCKAALYSLNAVLYCLRNITHTFLVFSVVMQVQLVHVPFLTPTLGSIQMSNAHVVEYWNEYTNTRISIDKILIKSNFILVQIPFCKLGEKEELVQKFFIDFEIKYIIGFFIYRDVYFRNCQLCAKNSHLKLNEKERKKFLYVIRMPIEMSFVLLYLVVWICTNCRALSVKTVRIWIWCDTALPLNVTQKFCILWWFMLLS